MNNFPPGSDQDILAYLNYDQQRREIIQQLQRENPSLFKRILKMGLLAILGGLGAQMLDQDPLKGVAAGAGAAVFLKPRQRNVPPQLNFPPIGK